MRKRGTSRSVSSTLCGADRQVGECLGLAALRPQFNWKLAGIRCVLILLFVFAIRHMADYARFVTNGASFGPGPASFRPVDTVLSRRLWIVSQSKGWAQRMTEKLIIEHIYISRPKPDPHNSRTHPCPSRKLCPSRESLDSRLRLGNARHPYAKDDHVLKEQAVDVADGINLSFREGQLYTISRGKSVIHRASFSPIIMTSECLKPPTSGR